jgi:ABC-type phosphate transport system ATPase subunit
VKVFLEYSLVEHFQEKVLVQNIFMTNHVFILMGVSGCGKVIDINFVKEDHHWKRIFSKSWNSIF